MAMVSLQSSYERARQHSSKGEYAQAEAICQHILQYYPQDLGAFQLLGQIHLEQKRAREARDYFRRVLEIDPENVSAHWGMGIAYQDEGQLENAIAEFEQALEIKPDLSDLRNQLLRAYTDLYGASRAQLRLSRAGLGRLYVKGEMYDKAVEEFYEVLKVDPERVDVQLSLLEVLWQRGQNDEAARVSEAVLARLPRSLKANLILGALSVAAGRQEEGEKLWRQAADCDPNNTMARSIFDLAPTRVVQSFLPYDAAMLPEFDEAAWKERLEAAAAAPPPEPAAPPPEGVVPAAAAPAEMPAAAEPAEVSWLDGLATGEGRVEETVGEEMLPGLAPFSMADMGEPAGLPAEEFSLEGLGEAAGLPAEEFSLEGLGEAAGLPGEEFSLEGLGEAAGLPAEEFSLEGLGEAAGLPAEGFSLEQELAAAAPAVPPPQGEAAAPPPRADDQVMQPFRLEELGLSAEEIASLEEAVSAAKHEGLAAGEAALPVGAEAGQVEEELLPGLAPFSLEEVPAAGAGEEEMAIPGLAPFSLEEIGAAAAAPAEAQVPGVEPFSLDALGLGDMTGEVVAAEAGGELRPFSLDDLGLDEPAAGGEAVSLDDIGLDIGAEVDTGLPAFSWQEPGSRPAPAFRGELAQQEEVTPAGPSLFEKMRASRVEPGGLEEEALEGVPAEAIGAPLLEKEAGLPELPPSPLEELGVETAGPEAVEELVPAGLMPFSVEDMGLGQAPPPVAAETPPGMPAPFSLAELGLEESMAPAAGEASLEGLQPFTLEGLGLEEPTAAAVEEMGAEALKPFSLEEMGLEEPTGPAIPEAAAVEELAEIAPFSLEEMGLETPAAKEVPLEAAAVAEAAAAAEVAAPGEETVKPFTLEELGLTPEEIASLGLSEEEMARIAAAPEVPLVPEVVAPAVEVAPALVEEVAAAVEEKVVAPVVEEILPAVEVAPALVEEVAAAVEEKVVAAVVEEILPAAPAEEIAVEAVLPAAEGPSLEELRQQHAAQPGDAELWLALARASAVQGQFDEALGHYKDLLKTGQAGLADSIIAGMQEWIGQEQEPAHLQRLHRLLGDAYMKKGLYQQAISEYAWVLSKK